MPCDLRYDPVPLMEQSRAMWFQIVGSSNNPEHPGGPQQLTYTFDVWPTTGEGRRERERERDREREREGERDTQRERESNKERERERVGAR